MFVQGCREITNNGDGCECLRNPIRNLVGLEVVCFTLALIGIIWGALYLNSANATLRSRSIMLLAPGITCLVGTLVCEGVYIWLSPAKERAHS